MSSAVVFNLACSYTNAWYEIALIIISFVYTFANSISDGLAPTSNIGTAVWKLWHAYWKKSAQIVSFEKLQTVYVADLPLDDIIIYS